MTPHPATTTQSVSSKLKIIGDLINNAFARPRRAWTSRDLTAYQSLARLQVEQGASFLDVNIDGTQTLKVRPEEMLEFLPKLVPAIQQVAAVPIAFDNPWVEFHRTALKHYDRSIGGAPIINSLAASRDRLDEMIDLVGQYDAWAIIMVSERFVNGGTAQCLSATHAYEAARQFVELLRMNAGRRNDQLIIDTGLGPVGADTYGLINTGLDAMRLMRRDPDLAGIHLSVGLTNFSWGIPMGMRARLEHAYLTIAIEAGLDFVLATPEKSPHPLDPQDPLVGRLREVLEAGRSRPGETQEDAGFRQAEGIMEICAGAN